MDTDGKGVAGEEPSTSDHPKLLYKYLDRYGLDTIANLELKITPPNEFNDPFEFTPRLTDSDERLRKSFRDSASRHFGVLCLCGDPYRIIPWAHYADGHTGLVLMLNLEAEPFKSLRLVDKQRWWCKVSYCPPQERKLIENLLEAARADDDNEFKDIIWTVAGEKSGEWEPENEYRIIIPLDLKDSKTMQPLISSRMVNQRLMYFLKLDVDAIRRIIIGERASPEFENEVRKAAVLHGIEGRVIRARIDRQRYAVVVD
jgi:hypothetical protein